MTKSAIIIWFKMNCLRKKSNSKEWSENIESWQACTYGQIIQIKRTLQKTQLYTHSRRTNGRVRIKAHLQGKILHWTAIELNSIYYENNSKLALHRILAT